MSSQLDEHTHIEYIDCWCETPDHVIRVSASKQDKPEEEPFLEFQYQLRNESFWVRLRTAILYLFFPSVCNWEGAMFDEDAAKRMSSLIGIYLESHRKWKLSSKGNCSSCEGTETHGPECVLNRCFP